MLIRLILTTFLLAITIFFQLSQSSHFLILAAVPLYVLIGATFFLGLLYAVFLPRIPNLWGFSLVQLFVDLGYFTALIYFTGGPWSIFTLIYIFPIISAGILNLRKWAFITAGLSSLFLIFLIIFQTQGIIPPAQWSWVSPWSRESFGYLLWILIVHITIFFLVAFLAGSLSEQLSSAQASLDVSASQFRKLADLHMSIVRSIASGIITTDETDRITYINAPGAKLLGTSLSELVSLPLSAVFPVISDELEKSGVRKSNYLTVEEINNEPVHLDIAVSDLTDEGGAPNGRLVIFQDVTQLKKMEDRIKLQEKQAALVRIAAGMAHEIRNPLASLRGATELLTRRRPNDESDVKLLNIVIRESDRLNSLLSDFLLTVFPRQSGSERVILTNVLEESITLFSKDPKFDDQVILETLLTKDVEVEGDPSRLKQALWNILSNSLEAIEEKGVIRVALDKDQRDEEAVIVISDTGSGIAPEIRDRIFEPFMTTKERGTGLGLSLVLSVIEAHNGSVELDSHPGNGTVFKIRIPLVSGNSDDKGGDIING
jgi:two-component system sensor histidine kinase PilS (NtrC family)